MYYENAIVFLRNFPITSQIYKGNRNRAASSTAAMYESLVEMVGSFKYGNDEALH